MSTSFGPVAAEVYERNMGRWSRRLATPFLGFVGDVSQGACILDVGCGTGSLTFALSERYPGASIVGMDLSEELVEHARSSGQSQSNIRFEIGDASALAYETEAFDMVLSNLVLNFIPDAEKAIQEMVRVTKPGGVIASTVWDLRGGMPHLRLVLDTAAALDESAHEYRTRFLSGPGVRPHELASLFQRSGLADVEEDMLTIRMEFQSLADFWEPTEQSGLFGAYLRSLPEAQRISIRNWVQAAYLLGDEDGYRSFAATAWAVKGVKRV